MEFGAPIVRDDEKILVLGHAENVVPSTDRGGAQ
jgi:hypothetical protein